MENKGYIGHGAALLTILIWGTTFISTKILLVEFKPIEILVFRFVMGFLALWIICPKRLKTDGWKQEAVFAAAGLSGICLYYLLENIALTYTLASNVGVIISVAPFFTAILAHIFIGSEEKFRVNFFAGFIIAMAGIVMISLNGAKLQLNPMGDFLAILSAIVWAVYSILSKKISGFGYPVVLTTRRTFFYGILFMIPAAWIFDLRLDFTGFADPKNLLNILYLGLGASALCFVTWNFAVKKLGAVKTSIYIYMVPVITVITSVLILGERITWMSGLGVIFTMCGLIISEMKINPKKLKRIGIFLVFLIPFLFTGCSGRNDESSNSQSAQTKEKEPETKIEEKDWSEDFAGLNGAAVIYEPEENRYQIYNQNLAQTRRSPCSTFKIISSLIALENEVIDPDHSVRKWSGEQFWNSDWNRDLSFEEAFRASCVWYFREVIDDIGKERMQKELDKLSYGNCDISDWEGRQNTNNNNRALTGFWIESSLKISPKEQTEVMERIFGDTSSYSKESLNQLKQVMLTSQDKEKDITIYGKTGMGKDNGITVDAWFTGFADVSGERMYFCVYLGETEGADVTSTKAKEIAIQIISDL